MGERVLYDPKDFLELQTGGSCSLGQMEADNRSRRSSTCLYLSRAFQPFVQTLRIRFWQKILKLKLSQYFAADPWLLLWRLFLVEIQSYVWSRFWSLSLVEILTFGWEFEVVEIWSIFVQEIVTRPKEVTLARTLNPRACCAFGIVSPLWYNLDIF